MYKSVQKKSSFWTPASIQNKSKSLSKPGTFSVQPKSESKSSQQQEIPNYSSRAAEALAANVMRSLETPQQEQEEAHSVQRQIEPGAAFVVEGVKPITPSSTPSIQSKEVGIQRQCSECAKEQQQESAEEGKDVDEKSLWASAIQTKLTVGAAGDKYEQEADRVAAQVMSMSVASDSSPQVQRFGEESNPVQKWSLAQSITPVVQRQVDEQLQMREMVQRVFQPGGTQASGDLESRLNASKGGGSALAPEVRAFMEPRFGADFSSVRVHTGAEAVQMNRELGAQAFAHGSDVYFGAGKSPGNNELTAHELTHVVQQTGQFHASRSNENRDALSPSVSRVYAQAAINRLQRHSTSDCDTSQSTLIATAITTAQSNIRTVTTQLGTTPLSGDMQNALWLYFRSSSPTTATTVSSNLNRISTSIGSLSYECENDCPENRMGYTRLGTMLTHIGNIHLCLNNLGSDANEVAETIIHEVAHYALLADDSVGYYGDDCEESETTVSAGTRTRLSLADSYSCLVKNWRTGNATDRANTRGDLTGANIAGISQAPEGSINLNDSSRRKPLFAMKLTRGPLAQITGVSYRWILRDSQERSYLMTDTDGNTLFQFRPASESVLAIINLPTRNLLRQRRITGGRVFCRATSPVFGEKLFQVPVTFQL